MFCNTPGNGAAEEHAALDKHIPNDDWSLEPSKVSENDQQSEPVGHEEICTESYCYTNWKPMRRN